MVFCVNLCRKCRRILGQEIFLLSCIINQLIIDVEETIPVCNRITQFRTSRIRRKVYCKYIAILAHLAVAARKFCNSCIRIIARRHKQTADKSCTIRRGRRALKLHGNYVVLSIVRHLDRFYIACQHLCRNRKIFAVERLISCIIQRLFCNNRIPDTDFDRLAIVFLGKLAEHGICFVLIYHKLILEISARFCITCTSSILNRTSLGILFLHLVNRIIFILSISRLCGIRLTHIQSSVFLVRQYLARVRNLKRTLKVPVNTVSLIIQCIKWHKCQPILKDLVRICPRELKGKCLRRFIPNKIILDMPHKLIHRNHFLDRERLIAKRRSCLGIAITDRNFLFL